MCCYEYDKHFAMTSRVSSCEILQCLYVILTSNLNYATSSWLLASAAAAAATATATTGQDEDSHNGRQTKEGPVIPFQTARRKEMTITIRGVIQCIYFQNILRVWLHLRVSCRY